VTESDLLRRIRALSAGAPTEPGTAALVAELRTLYDAVARLEERLALLDDGLGGLAEQLEALGRDGARTTAEALESLTARVDTVAAALDRLAEETMTPAAVRAEIGALRADLADALEESRDELSRRTDAAITAVQGALTAGQDRTGGALAELTETLTAVRATVDGNAADVARLAEDWDARADAIVRHAQELAVVAVAPLRSEVQRLPGEFRGLIADLLDSVRAGSAALVEGVDRLAAAGNALAVYLAERDLLLEQERDRVLLEEFARGLSPRARRKLSGRVADALDRRRDARDADRWRVASSSAAAPDPETAGSDPTAQPLAGAPAPAAPAAASVAEDPPVVEPAPAGEPATTGRRPVRRTAPGAPSARTTGTRAGRPATAAAGAGRRRRPRPATEGSDGDVA
jgi:hypothetical protein